MSNPANVVNSSFMGKDLPSLNKETEILLLNNRNQVELMWGLKKNRHLGEECEAVETEAARATTGV